MSKVKFSSRLYLLAMIPLILGGPATAEGQKLDLGELTCKEMMKLTDRDREAVMGFYFGYAAGLNSTAVLDLDGAAKTAASVIDDCLSNPSSQAMSVFKQKSQ